MMNHNYVDNGKILEVVRAIVKDEKKNIGEIRTQTAMRAIKQAVGEEMLYGMT